MIWFPVSLTPEVGRREATMAIATDATMPLLDTTGAPMLSWDPGEPPAGTRSVLRSLHGFRETRGLVRGPAYAAGRPWIVVALGGKRRFVTG